MSRLIIGLFFSLNTLGAQLPSIQYIFNETKRLDASHPFVQSKYDHVRPRVLEIYENLQASLAQKPGERELWLAINHEARWVRLGLKSPVTLI